MPAGIKVKDQIKTEQGTEQYLQRCLNEELTCPDETNNSSNGTDSPSEKKKDTEDDNILKKNEEYIYSTVKRNLSQETANGDELYEPESKKKCIKA